MPKFYLSPYAPSGLTGNLGCVDRRKLEAAEVPANIREASSAPAPSKAQLTVLSDGRGVKGRQADALEGESRDGGSRRRL